MAYGRCIFILPGVHRVTRFSVPVGVDGFESILVNRITTDSVIALRCIVSPARFRVLRQAMEPVAPGPTMAP